MPEVFRQAVTDRTQQFSVSIIDGYHGAGADFALHLHASAAKRYIFQVRDRSPFFAGFTLPDNFDQFST